MHAAQTGELYNEAADSDWDACDGDSCSDIDSSIGMGFRCPLVLSLVPAGSVRGGDQSLCILRENSKGLESLVINGSRFLLPDNSSLQSGPRAVPCFRRTALDNVGTKKYTSNQEQRTSYSTWKCIVSDGFVILGKHKVTSSESVIHKYSELKDDTK